MIFRLFSLFALCLAPCLAQAEVSKPKQIAKRKAAHCQSPRWAPDGSAIAFDVYDPKAEAREVWIQPVGSSGRRAGSMIEVAPGRAGASALLGGKKPPVIDLEWAPKMNMLSKPYVFSARSPKKNFDLFADGSWMTNNAGNDGQPAWSPDGRFIAYTSQRRDSGDIYVLDLAGDTGKPLKVTLWRNATEFEPRWSPTKPYLLFTRSMEGSKGQDIGIVMDVTRPKDTTRMVTQWTGDELRPSWSPDGLKVAFYSNKGNRNDKVFDLWVVGVDGKGAKKLAKNVVYADHRGPQWTPDGTTLLYAKKDFKRDNPVEWARVDGSAKGVLKTGTQLNSDLALYARGEQLLLAFKALGKKGSTEKTWQRVYLVTFSRLDLEAPEAP